jgi:beta-aspartyl-peptidase (threonine type)
MLLVASANASVGMDAAWEILSDGGSALDAAEAAVRVVEDNPDDHTVGYSGYPNVLGDVELDASIMEGTERRAGAVAGLRGYRAAISVARAVMDRTRHVLVVGEGAARMAQELGLQPENLLTDEAARVWRDGLNGKTEPGSTAERMLSRVSLQAADPEHAAGTVNVIARDIHGRTVTAVSTSGWAWKYPGRAGDSPVIGAGNYCDDRYGAAACTGHGELSMRASTARMVVARLAAGASLEAACSEAMRDLYELADDPLMHLVAVDAAGAHCGMTTSEASATYVFRTEGMSSHEVAERVHITR